MVMAFLAVNATAKERPFYNSKCNIVGISGAFGIFKNISANKYYYNDIGDIDIPPINCEKEEDIERWLNKQQIGKKVLDYLFSYHGYSLSETLLKERALNNIQQNDEERASIGVIDKETILKEDVVPILKHNYIYLEKSGKWMVFKVDITDDIIDMVYRNWTKNDAYNQIAVPVKFIKSGKIYKSPLKTFRKISKKVPELAFFGQVTGRHPFTTNIGSAHGIKNSDRMIIYRAKERNGKMYSTRVSTARACNVKDSTACLYTFAGGQASYKKGDVVLLSPNENSSVSFTGNMMNHSYGLNITYDNRIHLSKAGVSSYMMSMIGVGLYEHFQDRLYAFENEWPYYSPVIINVGLGYGLGFQMLHSMEIVPYFLAQYELNLFGPYKQIFTYENENYDKNKELLTAHAVRVPLGVKLNVNLIYPLQLVVGGEYIFNFHFSDGGMAENGENSQEEIQTPTEDFFFKPTGYKRDGINLYVGLRFNM